VQFIYPWRPSEVKIVRGRFKLTPEHMGRLVKAFTEAFDLGLAKPKQVVVRIVVFIFVIWLLVPGGS
jgi:hypothetical protein